MEKYVAYAADTHEYDFFPTFEAAAEWLLGDDWSEGYSQELIDGDSYIAEITHVTAVKVTDRKENYPLNGEEWPYGSFDWIGKPYMKKVEAEPMKPDIQNIIKAVRMLEEIHQPEYRMWISMENISALCDEIENNKRPPEVTQGGRSLEVAENTWHDLRHTT